MELVYLWVEEYKNIHRQGFNFSPKFNCNYDPDSNELTIDENDDHIENFFGDNINVTAIVGKNGSGKSSVFEVLSYLYWQGVITNKKDKTFFLYESDGHFYIQCENYKIHHGGFKELVKKINNKTNISLGTRLIHRTSMPLISFSNCISDMTHNTSLEKLKNYANFYNGIQPEDPMIKSDNIYDNFNQKFQDILRRKKDFFNFVDKNLLFDNFQIELHIYELGAWFAGNNLFSKFIIPEDLKNFLSLGITEADAENALYKYFALFLISKSRGIRRYDDLEERGNEEDEKYLKEQIFDKVENLFKQTSFGEIEYNKVLDICHEALHPSFSNLEKEVKNSFLYKDYNSKIVKILINKYTFHEANIFKGNILDIDKFTIESTIDTVFEKDLLNEKVLRVNFLKKGDIHHSFLNLSSGEKLYLNILTNLVYTLYHLEDDYRGVMLFDEIELSFHPAWQKQIIGHLLYIYNKVKENKKIDLHLIFTTHSPFLLSDIPKQNIIFLDTDEEGKCKVLKHDEVMNKIQTFGANIHTLLSNSFFMEDGLMGEFAKGKIENVINFLQEQTSEIQSYKDAENIISILGEPILKMRLEKMLDDYKIKQGIETEEDIEKKINELNQKLRKIKNGQDKFK